jgi:hypothetical protein
VGALDPEELRKGIKEGGVAKPKMLEPGSGDDEEEDESQMTQEQIGLVIFHKLKSKIVRKISEIISISRIFLC